MRSTGIRCKSDSINSQREREREVEVRSRPLIVNRSGGVPIHRGGHIMGKSYYNMNLNFINKKNKFSINILQFYKYFLIILILPTL